MLNKKERATIVDALENDYLYQLSKDEVDSMLKEMGLLDKFLNGGNTNRDEGRWANLSDDELAMVVSYIKTSGKDYKKLSPTEALIDVIDDILDVYYVIYEVDKYGEEVKLIDASTDKDAMIEKAKKLSVPSIVIAEPNIDANFVRFVKDKLKSIGITPYEVVFKQSDSTSSNQDNEQINDAYKQFDEILKNYGDNDEEVIRKVITLYSKHRGEDVWEKAFNKWLYGE